MHGILVRLCVCARVCASPVQYITLQLACALCVLCVDLCVECVLRVCVCVCACVSPETQCRSVLWLWSHMRFCNFGSLRFGVKVSGFVVEVGTGRPGAVSKRLGILLGARRQVCGDPWGQNGTVALNTVQYMNEVVVSLSLSVASRQTTCGLSERTTTRATCCFSAAKVLIAVG